MSNYSLIDADATVHATYPWVAHSNSDVRSSRRGIKIDAHA